MKRNILFIVFIFTFSISLYSNTDGFIILTQMLDAESKSEPDINSYHIKYDHILDKIKNEFKDEDNLYEQHKILFEIIHNESLGQYKGRATLSDLFNKKIYNCVTASLFYLALAQDLNMKIKIFETTFHVYLAFSYNSRDYIIELTDPNEGFDYEGDKEEYIELLLKNKYITEEEVKSKSTDELYNEYIVESKEININRLKAISCFNYATFYFEDKNNSKVFEEINRAIAFDKDSASLSTYQLLWSALKVEYSKDIPSSIMFLKETFSFPSLSKDFESEIIEYTSFVINKLLLKAEYEAADSLFSELQGYAAFTPKDDPAFFEIEYLINTEILDSKIVRGQLDAVLITARSFYNKYKNEPKTLDVYLRTAQSVFINLYAKRDYENILKLADTMYSDMPDVKSVEDIYVGTICGHVFETSLYLADPEKSKNILFNLNKKLPDNPVVKKSIGRLFREIAMKEIRERKYKDAIKNLEKGLEYSPEDYDLKVELKLTKDLLKTQ